MHFVFFLLVVINIHLWNMRCTTLLRAHRHPLYFLHAPYSNILKSRRPNNNQLNSCYRMQIAYMEMKTFRSKFNYIALVSYSFSPSSLLRLLVNARFIFVSIPSVWIFSHSALGIFSLFSFFSIYPPFHASLSYHFSVSSKYSCQSILSTKYSKMLLFIRDTRDIWA